MPPNSGYIDDEPDIPATPNHPCTRFTAKSSGYFLLFTGTCSDMVQKFYGASPTLGITDLIASLQEAKDPLSILRLFFLFSATASAGIQSYYLEKEFTLNFAKKRFGLLKHNDKLVAHGPKAQLLHNANAALFKSSLSLNTAEKRILGAFTLLGASVRDFTTIMGFDTVNSVMLAPKKGLACTLTAASVDFAQAIATDGEFLQKFYLIYRLWLLSTLYADQYPADFVKAMYNYLNNGDEDDDLHHCRTNAGYAMFFFVANVLGGLAVGSDVGIAKLALDSFAEIIHIDEQHVACQGLWFFYEYASLTSLFLLMYSMDARSLANAVTRRFEDRFFPEAIGLTDITEVSSASNPLAPNSDHDIENSHSSSSDDSTEEPPINMTACGHSTRLAIATIVCLLGACLSAINGYSGNQYLFNPDNDDDAPASTPNYYIMALSLLVAAIKLGQSLAVEGAYTQKGIMKTACPCAKGDHQTSIGKPYSKIASSDNLAEKLMDNKVENSVV